MQTGTKVVLVPVCGPGVGQAYVGEVRGYRGALPRKWTKERCAPEANIEVPSSGFLHARQLDERMWQGIMASGELDSTGLYLVLEVEE